jgi:tetratricopeptide (TPR) repeat protein
VYPLLIAAVLGIAVTTGILLIDPSDPYYFSGPFLGLLTFIPTFWLISRKVGDKVRPFFEQAQRQAQSGKVQEAIQSFEKALDYKGWQLFLAKQVNTQIGILHYASGEEGKAIEFLRKGYPKVSEGHLALGAALFRAGKVSEAREALELGIRYNKRSPVIYNVLAWILAKDGQEDAAIAVLQGALKPLKDDADTAENLQRLQNKKKLNMKPFGQLWYMLRFETLPGTAQAQPFRKGFRQAPKNPGKRQKGKKAKKR